MCKLTTLEKTGWEHTFFKLSSATRPEFGQTLKDFQPLVNSNVVSHVHIVRGQLQRKSVNPAIARQCQSLKYVNNISCVDQLCSVNLHQMS